MEKSCFEGWGRIHLWIASIENKEERQCEESNIGGEGHVLYKHFFAISLTVQSKGMKGEVFEIQRNALCPFSSILFRRTTE